MTTSSVHEPSCPTIFHVTHYKAGSQWVYALLRSVAPERVVVPRPLSAHVRDDPIRLGSIYPTVYLPRPQFEKLELAGEWRSFTVIRDLRDTLVSLYFSIRYSHPDTDEAVISIRNALMNRDQKQAMQWLLENRFRGIAAIQRTWLPKSDLLVKYEELIRNEHACFKRIVDHCGIDVSRGTLKRAIQSVSFESVSQRKKGEEDIYAHHRKGVAGDWRNHFDNELKEEFKSLYGDLLIEAGYEEDSRW